MPTKKKCVKKGKAKKGGMMLTGDDTYKKYQRRGQGFAPAGPDTRRAGGVHLVHHGRGIGDLMTMSNPFPAL